MAEPTKSHVFMNPDGYVEMVLYGRVSPEDLKDLTADVRALIEEQERPVGGLIDGREGNIVRNVETLRTLQDLSLPGLKRLVILLSTSNPRGIRKPSVVMSIFTTILGFRPIYVDNEEEARALASDASDMH